jgi:hypothetical protein
VNVNELLAGQGQVEARFAAATTRYNFKTGKAEQIIIIVSCAVHGGRYSFLFGVGGEHYQDVVRLAPGDPVSLERSGEQILLNRIPVRRLYQRTLDGVLELAGTGWKKLTGSTPGSQEVSAPQTTLEPVPDVPVGAGKGLGAPEQTAPSAEGA